MNYRPAYLCSVTEAVVIRSKHGGRREEHNTKGLDVIPQGLSFLEVPKINVHPIYCMLLPRVEAEAATEEGCLVCSTRYRLMLGVSISTDACEVCRGTQHCSFDGPLSDRYNSKSHWQRTVRNDCYCWY